MNMSNMMTDTRAIAELPSCGRRWLAENKDGITIWCRPPVRPPGLSDAEAIKDAAKWFHKRKVSGEACRSCCVQGPSAARAGGPGISESKDPIKHGYAEERRLARVPPPESAPRMLDDGSIVYKKVGWEPPFVPPGYKRKSDDLTHQDAWILVRKEPLCKHCELVRIRRANCDCLKLVFTCTRKGRAKNIQLDECSTCQNRK